MRPAAREILTIFWYTPGREGLGGEEVPGIVVYGLASVDSGQSPVFPAQLWPTGTDYREMKLCGDAWEVVLWEIYLPRWPSGEGWRKALRGTLGSLIQGGSVVSWLGDGVNFADPPLLLLPDEMSGAVLASMTSSGEFLCALDPDSSCSTLSDEDLLRLREHARGLADARENGG